MSTIIRFDPVALAPQDAAELLRAHIEADLRRKKPGTRRAYTQALQLFARWLVQWLPGAPAAIQSSFARQVVSVNDWWTACVALMRGGRVVANAIVRAFAAAGQDLPEARRPKPATVALRLAALRWIFRLANEVDAIPWTLAVRSPHVIAYRDVTGPSVEEVNAVFAVAARQRPALALRDLVLVGLLYFVGLRRFEVVGLDVRHYDPPRRALAILGKGKDEREPVTIPEKLAKWIEASIVIRGNPPPEAPLLVRFGRTRKGPGRLTADGAYRRVVWLGAQAGLSKRLTPHKLRHSAISTWLDISRGDVRRGRSFSRHQKLETLLVYDDRRGDFGGEVAEALAGTIAIDAPGAL